MLGLQLPYCLTDDSAMMMCAVPVCILEPLSEAEFHQFRAKSLHV